MRILKKVILWVWIMPQGRCLVFTYISSNLHRVGYKGSCYPNTFTHLLVFRIFWFWPLRISSMVEWPYILVYLGQVFFFKPLTVIIVNSGSFHSQNGPHSRDVLYILMLSRKNSGPIKVDQKIKHCERSFFPRRRMQFVSSEEGLSLSRFEILFLAAPSLDS